MSSQGPKDGSGVAPTLMSTSSDSVPTTPNSSDGEPDLPQGMAIGEYVIDKKLGEGGFGVVYSATHPVIGKQVAIKILNRMFSSDPAMVSRFVAEARAVNQIRHRNIIDIFSFGQLPDSRQYYVMELLSGMPLDTFVHARGGKLDPDEALPLLRAVARALDAAHAKGIAHRDLKPENVYVADDDGVPFPKLLDFGIAKLLGGDAPHKHKTRTGAPMGTPTYMSPEQCRGKDVDHRTDIYSFGIMTYQVLTGVLPFRSDDFVELLMLQTAGVPTPPSQLVPQLAPLDQPILHMMAKDPAARPAGLTVAVDAMYSALGIAMPAQTPSARGIPTPQGIRVVGAFTPSPMTPSSSQGAPSSFVSGEASPVASGGKSKLLIGIAGLLAVAGIAIFFVARKSGGEPTQGSATGQTPTPAPPTPPPIPSPTPPPPPEEPPPKPQTIATIELTIQGAPNGTQVYGPGHVLLGSLPGKLSVPRSDQALEITLELEGYASRTEKVAVATSTSINLPLKKKPGSVTTTTPGKGSGTGSAGKGSATGSAGKGSATVGPGSGKGSSEIPDF